MITRTHLTEFSSLARGTTRGNRRGSVIGHQEPGELLKKALLTAAEAAAVFGVCTRTIRLWIEESKLPAIRTPGGQIRIPAEAIREMVNKGAAPNVEPRAAQEAKRGRLGKPDRPFLLTWPGPGDHLGRLAGGVGTNRPSLKKWGQNGDKLPRGHQKRKGLKPLNALNP